MTVELYFENVDNQTQQKLLNEAGIDNPEEANWDVLPIATITPTSEEQ